MSNMNIIAELPVEQSLRQSLRASEGRYVSVGKRNFEVSNLKTFAVHGCKCVRCGCVGNKILAWIDKGGGHHIDLFNESPEKKLTLINRDHIIPKSKKGGNTEWNYQTMCVKCNCKKGNNETAEDLALAEFRRHWKNIYVGLRDLYWKYVPKKLRGRRTSKLFVRFQERHLHKVTYHVAKLTHKMA